MSELKNCPFCAAKLWNKRSDSDEITRLQSEVERLRGRCGELEKVVDDGSDAWLLRKQAEAVEAEAREWNPDEQAYSGRKPHKEMIAYAQRLRQQADEAEKAGG